MTSREKIQAIIDEIAAGSDSQLVDAIPFPVPASLIRMALNKIDEQLPQDPVDVDRLLRQGIDFLTALTSDPEEHANVH
jgi:hypothetical protein